MVRQNIRIQNNLKLVLKHLYSKILCHSLCIAIHYTKRCRHFYPRYHILMFGCHAHMYQHLLSTYSQTAADLHLLQNVVFIQVFHVPTSIKGYRQLVSKNNHQIITALLKFLSTMYNYFFCRSPLVTFAYLRSISYISKRRILTFLVWALTFCVSKLCLSRLHSI